MPQLFPANWINLSMILTMTIYLTLTFIFSSFIFKKKQKSKKFQKFNKHWKW